MPEVLAAKTGPNSFSVHPNHTDALKYIGIGQYVKVKITKSRNPHFHNKYWALINELDSIEAIHEHFKSQNDIHSRLKIDAGHCTTTKIEAEGMIVYHHIPKSINFDAMDETEFNEFYQKAINVILQKWLPEFVPQQLDQYADYFARNF